MINEFIVKDMYNYWKSKVERCEDRIKDLLAKNIQVVMSDTRCVNILQNGERIETDTDTITYISNLAEEYIFSLNNLKLCDKPKNSQEAQK